MATSVALHPEGVDRNIVLWLPPFLVTLSPSTRRAWIEMITEMVSAGAEMVALHPEGVDRNSSTKLDMSKLQVALHPEGVDRNTSGIITT